MLVPGGTKKLLIVAVLFFISCATLVTGYYLLTATTGAEWSRTSGGHGQDNCFSLVGTSDGGYLIGGWTSWYLDNESYAWDIDNFFLWKTDKNGNQEWYHIYGDNNSFMGGYAREAPEGGYLLAGNIGQYGAGSVYLVRTDTTGDVLWEKNYWNGFVGQVKYLENAPDGYVLAGNTNGSAFLMKFDRCGNVSWIRIYDDHKLDVSAVKPTQDGGFILTGGPDHASKGQAVLIKADSAGNLLWTKYYGCGYTGGLTVIESQTGGYVMAGHDSSDNDFWQQFKGSDIYVVSTDPDGNVLWEKTYNASTDDDYATSITQMDDGVYAITGISVRARSGHYVMDSDAFVLRLNQNGTWQWIKKFGSPGEARGIAMVQGSDGGLVLAGEKGNNGILLIKTQDAPDILSPVIEGIKPVEITISHNPTIFCCLMPLFILVFISLAITLVMLKRVFEKRVK